MKFEELLEKYQLQYRLDEFFDLHAMSLTPLAEAFREELRFAVRHRGSDDKEAFTSEFIVVPFLRETWKRHPGVNLFSHVAISAESVTVIPDYLVTAQAPTGYKTVYKPLLLTIEAKDERFDQGWEQALQQAIVCQQINQNPAIPIFAIVTTGDVWEFGKLDGRLFYKHPLPVSIQHPDEVLGVLDALFTLCEQSAARLTAAVRTQRSD